MGEEQGQTGAAAPEGPASEPRGHALAKGFGSSSGLKGPRGTRARKRKFIAAFSQMPFTVTAAAKAAGIDRRTFYDWLDDDPDFAALTEIAFQDGTDTIEEAVHGRAVNGAVIRRRFDSQGNVVAEEISYSDKLADTALKARRPAKYRERVSLEHSGAIASPPSAQLAASRDAGADEALVAALEQVASLDAARARRAAASS